MKDILGKEHAAMLAAVDAEQDPKRPRLKEGPAHAEQCKRQARELEAVEMERKSDKHKSGFVNKTA